MGEVTGRAAERVEALCGEAQRLLEGLGLMSPPKPKRHWWWVVAVTVLVAGGVVVAAVTASGRVFPLEE